MNDVEFLEVMEELRLALANAEVERYNFFVNNSTDGHECAYAAKCLKLFQMNGQRSLLESILRRCLPG